jgi:Ulp1 family protease
MFRNVDASHWYIIVVVPGPQKYYILDPLGRRQATVPESNERRRMPEVFDMISAIRWESPSQRPWLQVPTFFPQQQNGFDCGVFAIRGLALVLAGAKIAY